MVFNFLSRTVEAVSMCNLNTSRSFSTSSHFNRYQQYDGSDYCKSANGALGENARALDIAEDFHAVSSGLSSSITATFGGSTNHALDTDEKALQEMALGCQAIAKELLEALRKLKNKAGDAKWKSYWHGLKSVMAKEELKGISAQLFNYREELQLRLLVSLRYQPRYELNWYQTNLSYRTRISLIQIQQPESFARLDHSTQALIELLIAQKDQSRIDTSSIRDAIVAEHTRTRCEIRQGNAEVIDELRKDKGASLVAAKNTNFCEDSLSSLKFPSIRSRQEQITEAHAKTFEWIFEDPQEHTRPVRESENKSEFLRKHQNVQAWSDFKDWLKDEDGSVYWISGKAGSGKSTLMKYLYDNNRTRGLLQD